MTQPTQPPIVEAVGLSKSYPAPGGGRIEVFGELDLRLEAGQLIAIEGHSGCGKSTLLHVLGLLDPQSSGQVLYDGQPVSGLSEKGRADFRNRHLGFVFQFHHLLREFSALENVMMPLWIGGAPRAEAQRQAEESLVRVGLADRIQHRPGQLSGGEQQRVAVARALVNRPRLLLADEPTGNLDEQTAEGIHDLFLQLNEESGTSAVVVTHNRAFAQRFTRRYRLHLGSLVDPLTETEERSARL